MTTDISTEPYALDLSLNPLIGPNIAGTFHNVICVLNLLARLFEENDAWKAAVEKSSGHTHTPLSGDEEYGLELICMTLLAAQSKALQKFCEH